MWKKTLILIFMVLSFSSIAFAGDLIKLTCDTCGFDSGDLHSGVGMTGFINTVVYCEKCKNFFTVLTSVDEESARDIFSVVEPIGKKEFLGKERLVYPCPECGAEAVSYQDAVGYEDEGEGSICPVCTKGKLRMEIRGEWD